MENEEDIGFDKFMTEIVKNEEQKARRAQDEKEDSPQRIKQKRYREFYLNNIRYGVQKR